MGGRGASSSGGNNIYSRMVNNPRIIAELRRNVQAKLADNPNAKIGDTALDSDRIISNYGDTLTTNEYSNFNTDRAERELFKKLRSIEKEEGMGSKKATNATRREAYKNWQSETNKVVKNERARIRELRSQGMSTQQAVEKADKEFKKRYNAIDKKYRNKRS